jgi:unsaturated chondroitin disaccharide hydrolase
MTTSADQDVDVEAATDAALATVRANITEFAHWFPDDTTTAGTYRPRTARGGQPAGANVGWTTGFWPGMLWLAWENTRDAAVRRAASDQVDSFADRLTNGVDLDTHDLGFLYTLPCVTAWRLTGNDTARSAALAAADHLMTRFVEPAGIVQAWGAMGDPKQRGRTIIDSLMNMPLLYWASDVTGDDRYAAAAVRHTEQMARNLIRPDNSTFHTFYWDLETGEPLRGGTEQGHRDASCWARGQAWGIYGFAVAHRHTGRPEFLAAARACADHFLSRLPADHIPVWDLEFTPEDGEERDSSAAAIAVCGLAELAPHGDRYRQASTDILHALVAGYTAAGQAPAALLLHGVYDKPKNIGVDEGTLWGDYFYLEALHRRRHPTWRPYW